MQKTIILTGVTGQKSLVKKMLENDYKIQQNK